MTVWSEDPELLATFSAEVVERLSSLSAGLLQLEATPKAKPLMQGLLRDAHTLKGSARMLGLGDLVDLSHHLEEVLVGIRDGRLAVHRGVIDLLLETCETVRRGAPGGDLVTGAPEVADLVIRLTVAAANPGVPADRPPVRLVGHEPASPFAAVSYAGPQQPAAVSQASPALTPEIAVAPAVAPAAVTAVATGGSATSGTVAPSGTVASPTLRVAIPRVRDLLDAVEEVDHGARRLDRALTRAAEAGAEIERWTQSLTAELPASLHTGLATALLRLRAAAAVVSDATATAGDIAQDHRDRVTGVRDRAMALAMVPMRQLLAGYPTLVRRLATAAGAEVELRVDGEDVELDKRVLDAVADALGHLVTNAVDHGCETPARRASAGKPSGCTVSVTARNAGANVVVTVADDGAGVDRVALRRAATARNLLPAEGLADAALLDLLFHPGLSTRTTVGETSGRGVGLDVVRSAVTAVGGSVSVVSDPGSGTTFEVVLPVSLGVVHVLVARVGGESYAVPVTSVQSTLSLRDVVLQRVAGAMTIVQDGTAMPVLDLGQAVGARAGTGAVGLIAPHPQGSLVWTVDAIVGESDIVVRDLGGFLGLDGGVPGIAGATFDADGGVLCLLDLRETADAVLAGTPVSRGGGPATVAEEATGPARVLVVEDSIGVRELERAVLSGAGYAVTTCIDGLEAAEHVRRDPVDLVLSDVEMPGMTGIELTTLIRATPAWSTVPVVLMTSLGSDQDRRAGLAAGASAYLLKSAFAPEELLATVRRLIGR